MWTVLFNITNYFCSKYTGNVMCTYKTVLIRVIAAYQYYKYFFRVVRECVDVSFQQVVGTNLSIKDVCDPQVFQFVQVESDSQVKR